MLFVIGGSYQGKLDYVKKEYGIKDDEVFCCREDADLDLSKRCIYHYEKYVMYALEKGIAPVSSFDKNQIVIMDDINCGVVPVDSKIRAYRESVGRSGAALTRNADEVVRVFCGLSMTLKKKTTKIYLLRHGLTKANLEHLYCGNFDLPLEKEGIEELKRKKDIIAYPNPTDFDCYTSSRQRAKESFETIFCNAEYEEIAAFDEMNFGSFEMRGYTGDLEKDPDFVIWTAGDNESNVCPYGESYIMMRRRVFAEFDNILAKGKDAIIVMHGGPITALFKRYIPDSGLNFYEIQPKNGEGYMFEFDGNNLVRYEKIAE